MGQKLEMAEQQNKIQFALSMNITDFGQTSLKAQAIKMQKLALQEQLEYKKRESVSNFELSIKYIQIAKENILTTEQNVVANQKTFNAIDKKYEARVIDNVAYLDALNSLNKCSILVKWDSRLVRQFHDRY